MKEEARLALGPLVRRLEECFSPLQIWLFGSRARGEARPDSDWDLAVVVRDDADEAMLDPLIAWRARHEAGLPADIVLFRATEFAEDRTTANTIPYVVAQEGWLVREY